MRRFAELYQALDAATATTAKVRALVAWYREAEPADAAWVTFLLSGGRPPRAVPTARLREAACAWSGLPDWLFEASYQVVGDLAETIAHLVPPPRAPRDEPLAAFIETRVLPLRGRPPEAQVAQLRDTFDGLAPQARFLLVKLIGGGFRVGVSRLLVQRALAEAFGLDAPVVAQRMVGWTDARTLPTAARFAALVAAPPPAGQGRGPSEGGLPYPFFLAQALPQDEAAPQALNARLGPPADWLVEWKFDGIRAQVVRRGGQVWIWSRGEELVSHAFPDLVAAARAWPDGSVLDGEIVVWRPGQARPEAFGALQRRLGRKTAGRRLLSEAPACFIAYDLLEREGEDLRGRPQAARRALLEAMPVFGDDAALAAPQAMPGCDEAAAPADRAARASSGSAVTVAVDAGHAPVRLSPWLRGEDWATLATLRESARALGVEGLMLKRLDARYGAGRTRADGVWWKWKVQPLRVDGVLIYAQAGHGRRAGVYTDYTFGLWSRPPRDAAEAQAVVQAIARREPPQPGGLQLVAFAKAYSGLTDEEFARVDRVIRATTLEKFGPVRSVRPTLVFELGFEAINPSARHKSGVAVRFPRMLRLREDKPLHEADTLPALKALAGLEA